MGLRHGRSSNLVQKSWPFLQMGHWAAQQAIPGMNNVEARRLGCPLSLAPRRTPSSLTCVKLCCVGRLSRFAHHRAQRFFGLACLSQKSRDDDSVYRQAFSYQVAVPPAGTIEYRPNTVNIDAAKRAFR